MISRFILSGILLMMSMTGCASPRVTRTPVEKIVDLSGRWNDTDSRLAAEEMIKDCLARPWINTFNEKAHRDPIVIVGTVVNRSHEHIDSQLFTKDLEKNVLNSGKVKFIASRQERPDLREERDQQRAGTTDPETIKPQSRETGADFMVQGTINSVKDEIRGKYVILYQVNLELVDLTTNQKVWIGQKEIKKVVAKSKYSL